MIGDVLRCPQCGSKDTRRIVYGFPTDEAIAAELRGEVCMGGCLVGPQMPTRVCLACEAQWTRSADFI
jgi:hypothetical protein